MHNLLDGSVSLPYARPMIEPSRFRASTILVVGGLFGLAACPDPNIVTGTTTVGDDEVGDETGGDEVDEFRTYFIGESVTFDGGGGCNNTELNTITSTLRNELDDAGWSGLRFVDGNAWPEDFQEPNLNPLGLDWVYGDTARLAMYAGHGNAGLLQWGTPSANGTCQLTTSNDVRLGTLAGDRATAVMFMTSCTLRTDAIPQNLIGNASRQFFGYHNSPYIGYDEPRKVFKRTQDGQSNRDAWLDEMEQNADIGKNSPVVVTYGTSPQDALDSEASANLASGDGLTTNVGEPADNFIFTWYNNGCTPVCGGNCNSLPPPSLQVNLGLGDPLPLVELERPFRTQAQLLSQVEFMLPFFGVDSASVVDQAALEDWSRQASTEGEVAFAEISQNPRITVSYDPVEDRLRITDLDALEVARPSAAELAGQRLADVGIDEIEPVARNVRDAIQTQSPSAGLAVSFNISTREVGYLDPISGYSEPTPVEYRFEFAGRIEGLDLPARSLRIGVSRLGELSSIVSSGMHADIADSQPIVRLPEEAMAEFEGGLLQQHPEASAVEFTDVQIGYALPEETSVAVAEPSVLLRYSLVFDDSSTGRVMVSRGEPVSLSLVSACLHPVPLTALDPYPDPGDVRRDP